MFTDLICLLRVTWYRCTLFLMHNTYFHTTLPKTQVSRGDETRWFGVSGAFFFARGKMQLRIPSDPCHRVMWNSAGGTPLKAPPLSVRTPEPRTVLVDLSRTKSPCAIKVDFVSSKRLKYVAIYINQYTTSENIVKKCRRSLSARDITYIMNSIYT